MTRTLTLCSVVLLACGVPPAPMSSGSFTLEAPGAGEPNVDSLWPITTGQQFGDFVVRARIAFGGHRAWPYSSTRPYLYGGGPSPEMPGKASYFARAENGDLLLVGDSRRGVFATPAVWLPREVRVGMRWSTGLSFDGGPRFITRVVSRSVEPTLVGARTVWTLEIFDRETFFPDQRNEITLRGALFAWRFAEGFGPLGDGIYDFTRFVAPLAPVPELELSAPELQPRPLRGGAVVQTDFLPTWASSVEVEGASSPLGLVGVSSSIGASDFMGGVMVGSGPSLVCLSDTGTAECRSAVGALPLAGGGLREIPTAGLRADRTLECELNPGPGCRFRSLNALWLGTDGGVQVAVVSGGTVLQGDWVPAVEGTGNAANLVERAPSLIARVPQFAHDLVWSGRLEDEDAFIAPVLPALNWVRLSATGPAATKSGPRVPSTIGFHATSGGRDYLVVHHDGRIEEVRTTKRGVELAVLGSVKLPAGHVAMAAVRKGGVIVVASNTKFRGRDAQFRLDGWDPQRRPDHGELFLWEVDDVPAASWRTPTPLETLEVRASGRDVTVCWHGGDGSKPVGDWKLGGEPARVLWAAGDPCAVVVRAPTQRLIDAQVGAFALEGEFSVGGRFVFGEIAGPLRVRETEREAYFNHEIPLAPVSSGGFVGSSAFSSGLEVEGVLSVPVSRACQPDLGGAGLWCGAQLVRRDSAVLIPQADGGRAIVQGGGVLVGSTVVRADAGTLSLNLGPDDGGWVPGAVLQSGVIVGRPDNGFTVTAVSNGAVLWDAPVNLEELVAVGDSVWGRTLGVSRPATGLTAIGARDGGTRSWSWPELLGDGAWAATSVRYATSPGGRVFAMLNEDRAIQYGHALFELTEAGPVALDVPGLRAFGARAELAIAVDDAALVAWPVPVEGERVNPREFVRVVLAP